MTNAIARKLPTVARLLLGLPFLVFGLNGFLHFMPQPPAPPAAGAFVGALLATGFMVPLQKTVEVVAALLLLSGRAVPFALTLLAPVIVCITGFHLFLAPGGWPVVLLLLACEGYLAWTHRAAFAPLFLRTRRPQSQARATAPTMAQAA
jgi:putative oxidoreductase